MLTEKIKNFLKEIEFIHVASSDLGCRPSAAVKLVLKIDGNHIYLVDYTEGRTYNNLKTNPWVSLSFANADNLKGYQVNGPVEIIDKGQEYDIICAELRNKEINLSTERIIKAVSAGRVSEDFEIAASKKFVIFKVKIESVAEFKYSGEIRRENLRDL